MANTYSQIYIHVVFAVEGRHSLIRPQYNDELQKYITGIVSGQNQKLIAIIIRRGFSRIVTTPWDLNLMLLRG